MEVSMKLIIFSLTALFLFTSTLATISDSPFIVAHKKASLTKLKLGVDRVFASIDIYNFGSAFMPIHTGAERDLRFVFCAASICSMLENWSDMDREKAKENILNCQSYDGGFGLIPGSESHAGHLWQVLVEVCMVDLPIRSWDKKMMAAIVMLFKSTMRSTGKIFLLLFLWFNGSCTYLESHLVVQFSKGVYSDWNYPKPNF